MQQRDQVEVSENNQQIRTKSHQWREYWIYLLENQLQTILHSKSYQSQNRLVTEDLVLRNSKNQIQENQFKYILVLSIHFGVALLVIGLLTHFNLSEQILQIPFIIWVVLLMLYILSLALAQFSNSQSLKSPKNVFLFVIQQFNKQGVNTIVRLFWFVYAVILYPELNLGVFIAVIFINLIIILICSHFDKEDGIKNCFLVSDQPWRISFVLLFEILFVGLYLNIQDMMTAIIWQILIQFQRILILFFIYSFTLLNIQLVEFRKHLGKNGNLYFLSQLYYDGDIIFPCYFLEHQLACTSERSILK
ncbi:unnamed protein product (macronuclear) [Paramecium tetraurelia]|uniref:Transmembrane protein n=1 Tax=Paramecium tetraurelia TaxID=5888 RepID=A0CK83_PARTE|nr:uncharacterized protein GSPATT00000913001 [Paramecium tetraurelia]CAK71200.1 unnamed protein product [Paramecium tetraurelia]|eukprot:XP_001438597.1 hypothetical protein (macronuclear) [Paramecium tetraurelia strain d4-2]